MEKLKQADTLEEPSEEMVAMRDKIKDELDQVAAGKNSNLAQSVAEKLGLEKLPNNGEFDALYLKIENGDFDEAISKSLEE
ncbi:MAG: hypothetical protein KGJ35_03375 [Patescibacteria group bacterium]|nr:hypothetical protein [Patescibacteria group bacterium]